MDRYQEFNRCEPDRRRPLVKTAASCFFLIVPARVAASISASFGGPGVICALLDLHVNK